MALQALLDNGDEVLIPAPDYPLWTAAVSLCGGTAGALPLRRGARAGCPTSTTSRPRSPTGHQALVIINPNNPTGAVYSARAARAARRAGPPAQPAAVLRRDLRQDPLRRRRAHLDRRARPRPALPDLQRAVQGVPGGRVPHRLDGRLRPEAARRRATSRAWTSSPTCGCARTCRPSTRCRPRSAATRASTTWSCPAAGCSSSATSPGELLNAIPGVSCVKPKGALYVVPAPRPGDVPDPRRRAVRPRPAAAEQLLVVQGTGFNWPAPDHFRIVTLPRVEDLEEAIGRIAEFLATRRRRPRGVSSPPQPRIAKTIFPR